MRTTKGACRRGSGGGRKKGKKNGLVRDGGGVFPDGPRPSRTGSNTFGARLNSPLPLAKRLLSLSVALTAALSRSQSARCHYYSPNARRSAFLDASLQTKKAHHWLPVDAAKTRFGDVGA